MPIYSYTAVDAQGKKRTGDIEANSEKEAKSILRDQGVIVTKFTIYKTNRRKGNLSKDQQLTFTMQLAQLVGAGIPIYESLTAIEEQCREEPYHRTILSICEQIKRGTSLSDAMVSFPQSFDRLYIAMIKAGESSGSLGPVLEELNTLLAKQNKLKKDIMTALIYPAILSTFALLVIAVLLGFVVPSIEGIFSERKLNTFTAIILGASHIFRDYWWLYLPVIAGSITLIVWKLRTPAGKIWLEKVLMRTPLVRTLMIQAAVTRFCRTLATLQRGGLPVIESMRIAREVMQNSILENEVKLAEGKIIEGSSLSRELGRSKWIPVMVPRMLSVGEDTGNTTVMLLKIADIYEQEVAKSIEQIMAFAQPIILVVMGGVIGIILMSILLPLTDMSSFSL